MLDTDYSQSGKDPLESAYPLVLRISHKSKKKYIQTGYRLTHGQWDEGTTRVTKEYKNSGRANARITRMLTVALDICSRPKETLKELSVYDVAKVIQENLNTELNEISGGIFPVGSTSLTGPSLKEYGHKIVARYRKAKRHGMADSFDHAITALLKYYGKDDIPMKRVTVTFLEEFEAEWLGKGNKLGGLGVHLRAIRRIFNLAIKDDTTGLTMENYPFGNHGYSIKRGRTKKRAISVDYIQKIRELRYEPESALWHHKNYFLFMFNLRGMNFIDLSQLKLENIKGDRLIYERSKTRRGDNVKTFNIKLSEEAKGIVNHYSQEKRRTELLFPILTDVANSTDDLKIHRTRKNRLANHNRRLNKIAKDIGLEEKLTTYVARHTFATAGLHKGVSKTQIGEMLGHTSAVTTEAYFDEFDKKVLDEAADIILQ